MTPVIPFQLHDQVATLANRVKDLEEEATKYDELAERAEHLADTLEVWPRRGYYWVI